MASEPFVKCQLILKYKQRHHLANLRPNKNDLTWRKSWLKWFKYSHLLTNVYKSVAISETRLITGSSSLQHHWRRREGKILSVTNKNSLVFDTHTLCFHSPFVNAINSFAKFSQTFCPSHALMANTLIATALTLKRFWRKFIQQLIFTHFCHHRYSPNSIHSK